MRAPLLAVLLLCACEGTPSTTVPRPTIVEEFEVHSEPWSFDGNSGVRLRTPSWDIRTTIRHDRITDMLPRFYERALERYATALAPLPWPRQRLNVYLLGDQRQWQSKLVDALGAEAAQWTGLGRGGVTVDGTALLYDLDGRGRSRATLRIAAHEGWHQYAEAVLRDPLPTWLDEGIATWMEGFRIGPTGPQFQPLRNWDRIATLRRVIAADALGPLRDLLDADPATVLEEGRQQLLGYYAQLWALTCFLAEDEVYQPRLAALLLAAHDGRLRKFVGSQPSATDWLAYFDEDTARIEIRYRRWAGESVRPGRTSN